MTTTQDPSTSVQLQVLQSQEASLAKQLAGAESRLKSYEQQAKSMSSTERDLNLLVRQNRESDVVALRGQLDAIRKQIQDVQSGVAPSRQVIARVEDGPLVVQSPPPGWPITEPPHFFGLEPRQFGEPALFLLALPLVLALSRWIWRRSPMRPSRDAKLDGNPQITRLEQAVEAIAIEVERISEAQRFSAKLMAERPKEAVIERMTTVKPQRRVVTPLP